MVLVRDPNVSVPPTVQNREQHQISQQSDRQERLWRGERANVDLERRRWLEGLGTVQREEREAREVMEWKQGYRRRIMEDIAAMVRGEARTRSQMREFREAKVAVELIGKEIDYTTAWEIWHRNELVRIEYEERDELRDAMRRDHPMSGTQYVQRLFLQHEEDCRSLVRAHMRRGEEVFMLALLEIQGPARMEILQSEDREWGAMVEWWRLNEQLIIEERGVTLRLILVEESHRRRVIEVESSVAYDLLCEELRKEAIALQRERESVLARHTSRRGRVGTSFSTHNAPESSAAGFAVPRVASTNHSPSLTTSGGLEGSGDWDSGFLDEIWLPTAAVYLDGKPEDFVVESEVTDATKPTPSPNPPPRNAPVLPGTPIEPRFPPSAPRPGTANPKASKEMFISLELSERLERRRLMAEKKREKEMQQSRQGGTALSRTLAFTSHHPKVSQDQLKLDSVALILDLGLVSKDNLHISSTGHLSAEQLNKAPATEGEVLLTDDPDHPGRFTVIQESMLLEEAVSTAIETNAVPMSHVYNYWQDQERATRDKPLIRPDLPHPAFFGGPPSGEPPARGPRKYEVPEELRLAIQARNSRDSTREETAESIANWKEELM